MSFRRELSYSYRPATRSLAPRSAGECLSDEYKISVSEKEAPAADA